MVLFMLDVETTSPDPNHPRWSLNPDKGQLLTIQYQNLERREEPLVILKSWQHPDGERGIVKEFLNRSAYWKRKHDFTPVGWNLAFDMKFLFAKSKRFGFLDAFARYENHEKPLLDLQHWARLCLGGQVTGSKLEHFTRKTSKVDGIPQLAARRDWPEVVDYIRRESGAFVALWDALVDEMPGFYDRAIQPRAGGMSTSQIQGVIDANASRRWR